VKALAELLNAKPGEIPAPSLEASFHPGRIQEFQSEMQAAGIPLQPFSVNMGPRGFWAVLK
jgi:hypothetical protein